MSSCALPVFHYVTTDKAWLYRPLMRVFSDAKTRFVLHLRPGEIAWLLCVDTGTTLEGIEIERALNQLCEWGNLQRHFDTADVATVQQFNQPRYLYQITTMGQAAERALRTFEDTVEQPGELQSAALGDIRDHLAELAQLASEPDSDGGKVSRVLEALVLRFEQLTTRAQTFISSLQSPVQLQATDLDTFVAYKKMLVDYLERFINELVVRSTEIGGLLERIESAGVDRLLDPAIERELVDVLGVTKDQRSAALERWRQRWRGLRGWFIADEHGRSQAEELRAHARRAIPALLRVVANIHDRRLQRSDRVADLRTLARWFATCPDERTAAKLWRAAFALSPARHLRVTDETLSDWDQRAIQASTSWFDAPPLRIAPRLRRTGRHTRRGRTRAVIDHSTGRAQLAAIAADQTRQIEEAQRTLETHGPILLSQIGRLDRGPFELFLELLGEALSRKQAAGDAVEATSMDGATWIRLQPAPKRGSATLETPFGRFSGDDHIVHIHTPGRPADETGAAKIDKSDCGDVLLAGVEQ